MHLEITSCTSMHHLVEIDINQERVRSFEVNQHTIL